MEQENHLTQQEARKSVTKATARHLRRKRLKDARRAEERQYLDILDGQTALDLASAGWDKSVFSHSAVNLSLPDPLNDLTIAAILKKLASLEDSHAKLTNFPHSDYSSNVIDEARCINGVENFSQTTNDKKKKKKKKHNAESSVASVTLEEDSLNASSSNSESNVFNLNCDSSCSASRLDSDLTENGQILEQSVNVNIADSDNSAQNDIEPESIEIKSDEAKVSITNHVNCLSANNVSDRSIIKTTSSQSDISAKNEDMNVSTSLIVSTSGKTFHSPVKTKEEISTQKAAKMKAYGNKDEKLDTSPCEPMSSIKMIDVDSVSSLPEKTKEEVKAEREAKKAAKAAAKAKAKSKKAEKTTDNVKKDSINELSPTEPESVSVKKVSDNPVVANAQNSQKINVMVTLSQSLQAAKETEESSIKSATRQSPIAQVANVMSPAVSRLDNTISDGKADGKAEGKSKAELRAERRAKQEAQRAAKQLQQISAKQQLSSTKSNERSQETPSEKPRTQQAVVEAVSVKKIVKKSNDHQVNLFQHLYNERELSLASVPINSNIHPAIIGLGAQYTGRTIVGSNARCVALLAAVKQVILDFEKPEQADFTRSLEICLRDLLAYLHRCRPVAVSMQNAMRHLKWHMTNFSVTMSTCEAKTKLTGIIDTYITEQIQLAGKAISITIQTKISNGNIILIYGFSSLIYNILVDAHAAGKQFRVIVVDGRPWLEGREQLKRLAKHGINCSYMFINAVSFIMSEVSKVFLSAHAILANGAVMSRVGTSQIALIAKAFNVPVLVACETHKTCGRVQTDSIVYNELGNADDLVTSNQYGNSRKSLLTNWRARKSLNLLNITYDVTPADLITAVVTELAILPCTSVPVILRIKPSEF
ncbi:translation initiation factor eIF-2B subunit delta-like isoform X2 [Harpegnathos saltator]|uniref:translation initiation factor eIF-2B subunit delta-like isoform X2 n=1 Tax=Harpegnathos saltator TaxID=610380 RepID=UPI000DBEDF85|nr:translation initiation factor eIF-2B subunit delta-like isoform X2 [Harpegnathos saltator]